MAHKLHDTTTTINVCSQPSKGGSHRSSSTLLQTEVDLALEWDWKTTKEAVQSLSSAAHNSKIYEDSFNLICWINSEVKTKPILQVGTTVERDNDYPHEYLFMQRIVCKVVSDNSLAATTQQNVHMDWIKENHWQVHHYLRVETAGWYWPSVRRALPPVGWHRTVEQPTHRTTVWAWLNTVVIL